MIVKTKEKTLMQNETVGTVLITQEQINDKAAEIGRRIEEDFKG